jgi:hypothetical protein
MNLGRRSKMRLGRARILDKMNNTKLYEITFWKLMVQTCKNKNGERCKYYTEQLNDLVKLN